MAGSATTGYPLTPLWPFALESSAGTTASPALPRSSAPGTSADLADSATTRCPFTPPRPFPLEIAAAAAASPMPPRSPVPGTSAGIADPAATGRPFVPGSSPETATSVGTAGTTALPCPFAPARPIGIAEVTVSPAPPRSAADRCPFAPPIWAFAAPWPFSPPWAFAPRGSAGPVSPASPAWPFVPESPAGATDPAAATGSTTPPCPFAPDSSAAATTPAAPAASTSARPSAGASAGADSGATTGARPSAKIGESPLISRSAAGGAGWSPAAGRRCPVPASPVWPDVSVEILITPHPARSGAPACPSSRVLNQTSAGCDALVIRSTYCRVRPGRLPAVRPRGLGRWPNPRARTASGPVRGGVRPGPVPRSRTR